jgi:hypothetical protein
MRPGGEEDLPGLTVDQQVAGVEQVLVPTPDVDGYTGDRDQLTSPVCSPA